MWEINSFNQYTSFLYSIIMGLALGIIYDLFKLDRNIFKRSTVYIFVSDVLFWVISAFVLFSFCIVFSNGQIRGFIILGALLGFMIFRLTLSRLFWYFFKPIKKIIQKLDKVYSNLLEKANFILCRFAFWFKKTIKNILFTKKQKIIK